MALRLFSISFAIFAAVIAGSAQLPVARLHTLAPAGGQIGATFEVSISGADLDDVTTLRFTDTNIVAKPKVNGDTGLAEPNKFIVTISSNAVPALGEVRTIGRFGLSNPRHFVIGRHAEAKERGDNHASSNAMDVALGTTVNGQADANAFDFFRFTATQGQRVLIECATRAIDSRMEPLIVLHDSAGRELHRARNRDSINFVAGESGTNVLKVSDLLYRGGAEYFYRVTVHTGPQIEFVMPPSAQPGTTNKHMLYGWNLPGSTPATNMSVRGHALEKVEVEIVAPSAPETQLHRSPASLGMDGFHYRLKTDGHVSDPVFIGLARAPVVSESATNDRPEIAQSVSLPCEIAGQFYPAGDQDWFSFEAKKGEVYWLEVLSQRLGAPADPMMVVQRVTKTDKGEVKAADLQESYDSDANIGGQEFKTSSRDPAWRFEVKEDGTYRVQVRDLFNRTSADPANIYRLVIRKEAPAFQLAVIPQLPPTKKEREVAPWSTVLRRGETLPIKVLADRVHGFAGEISVHLQHCPPEIMAAPAKIEAGKNSTLLFLTARENATNWASVINVVGKGKHGSNDVASTAVEGTSIWRVEDYNTEAVAARTSPDVVLATVDERAPVTVSLVASNALEAAVGTKLQIPLVVARNGDFNEKLKLKSAGAQPLDSAKELEIDAKTTNATFELDLNQAKLGPGTHLVYFQTQTKGKYSNDPEGAKAAELAAKDAETNATLLATEVKKAIEAAAATVKAATEADQAAKAATEKLAAAKSAAEQNNTDQNLVSAVTEAERVLTEATSKAKAAADAKAAAEKTSADFAVKSKQAEVRKAALAARAKELGERAKPKEVTIGVYSRPFEVKVNPAPATAKK